MFGSIRLKLQKSADYLQLPFKSSLYKIKLFLHGEFLNLDFQEIKPKYAKCYKGAHRLI